MTPLKTIAEELAACRKAFANHTESTFVYGQAHESECEKLVEPIENRIAHILSDKPEEEQAMTAAAWAEYVRDCEVAWAEYVRVCAAQPGMA